MAVLCATDFSPSSKTAVDIASGLARRLGDSLLLLHVVEPHLTGNPDAAGELAKWQQDMLGLATERLHACARALGEGGLAVGVRVLLGSPASLILKTAAELSAKFIVLGTHRRRGPARLLLGSVASRVVKSADCPVLVTREAPDGSKTAARWSGEEPLRLALAADGTPASEAALQWTAGLAPPVRRDLTVVRLSWPPQEAIRHGLEEPWSGVDPHPAVIEALERDLRRQMQGLALLAVSRVRFRTAHVDGAEVLADEARRLEADAIVVGVPRNRLQAWNAVVPAALLQATSTPVICVPQASAPSPQSIPRVSSVLVATDLSDLANRGIPAAYGLLRAGGGRVELCHVQERGDRADVEAAMSPKAPLDDGEKARILQRLRALVPAEAEARGILTNTSVLEGASAGEAILAASLRLDVDIIALASHGRSGIERALLGSVAEHVARHSTRPVLIVHIRGA